jgi:hypothetical protein
MSDTTDPLDESIIDWSPPSQRDIDRTTELVKELGMPEQTTAWTPPPATDEQFRAAGYTVNARKFPLSEAAVRWVAEFNGIPFEKIPPAWCYAPNPFMHTLVEEAASVLA